MTELKKVLGSSWETFKVFQNEIQFQIVNSDTFKHFWYICRSVQYLDQA